MLLVTVECLVFFLTFCDLCSLAVILAIVEIASCGSSGWVLPKKAGPWLGFCKLVFVPGDGYAKAHLVLIQWFSLLSNDTHPRVCPRLLQHFGPEICGQCLRRSTLLFSTDLWLPLHGKSGNSLWPLIGIALLGLVLQMKFLNRQHNKYYLKPWSDWVILFYG